MGFNSGFKGLNKALILLFLFYEFKILSVVITEEHEFGISENRMLRGVSGPINKSLE